MDCNNVRSLGYKALRKCSKKQYRFFRSSSGMAYGINQKTKVMDKEAILKKYLEWVDQVSEDIEDKSHFTPQEIVFKVCDIIQEQNRKSAMLNPANLDDTVDEH